jgi:hypothetical protein
MTLCLQSHGRCRYASCGWVSEPSRAANVSTIYFLLPTFESRRRASGNSVSPVPRAVSVCYNTTVRTGHCLIEHVGTIQCLRPDAIDGFEIETDESRKPCFRLPSHPPSRPKSMQESFVGCSKKRGPVTGHASSRA